MKRVDLDEIRDFYNNASEIWAPNDHWHLWSRKQIQNFIDKIDFTHCNLVLNAGSAGNDYGVRSKKMIHIDIAEDTLRGVPNSVVGNIEHLPFEDELFDGIICVGSVINYCDALAVISEFSRVSKPGANVIIEFENSAGYEYRKTSAYKQPATTVTVKFQGKDHTQWLYSISYIKALLLEYGFEIKRLFPFQIMSSLILSITKDETASVRYARFDNLVRKLGPVAMHANNMIVYCKKL